jgi:hypothetical protein
MNRPVRGASVLGVRSFKPIGSNRTSSGIVALLLERFVPFATLSSPIIGEIRKTDSQILRPPPRLGSKIMYPVAPPVSAHRKVGTETLTHEFPRFSTRCASPTRRPCSRSHSNTPTGFFHRDLAPKVREPQCCPFSPAFAKRRASLPEPKGYPRRFQRMLHPHEGQGSGPPTNQSLVFPPPLEHEQWSRLHESRFHQQRHVEEAAGPEFRFSEGLGPRLPNATRPQAERGPPSDTKKVRPTTSTSSGRLEASMPSCSRSRGHCPKGANKIKRPSDDKPTARGPVPDEPAARRTTPE